MRTLFWMITLSLAIAGCTTLCKVPGVGMIPGVTCASPSPTPVS